MHKVYKNFTRNILNALEHFKKKVGYEISSLEMDYEDSITSMKDFCKDNQIGLDYKHVFQKKSIF